MPEYNALIEHVNLLKKLTDFETEELKKSFFPKTFQKGEYLTEYGKPTSNISFVTSGFVRDYVIDTEGNEVTVYLSGKGDWIGAISSFLKRRPSDEYIMAVTDVELLCINYEMMMGLYESSHTWAIVGLHIMENLFLQNQKKVMSFIKKTAEERYIYLLENEKELLLNVPMQHVASYLGIKPETLSRIRARIS
jgi:CRP-like cAMP-binding protein